MNRDEREVKQLEAEEMNAGSLVTPSRRGRDDPEGGNADEEEDSEVLNAKAVSVIGRVESKLTGKDFGDTVTLDVTQQVENLIRQATSHLNLCQCYIGWCACRALKILC